MKNKKSTHTDTFTPPIGGAGGGSYIEIQVEGPVARINLNRPERHNALILELIEELSQALDELAIRADINFVVLSGNGHSFCAGADLNWFYGSVGNNMEENVERYKPLANLLLKLRQLPLITIACVRGNVFGGGIGLMAACDFVLAETNTRFMFSEVKLGLLPATILPFVAQRLSLQYLRKWILTGSLFHTPEAQLAGLVDVICDDSQSEKCLHEFLSTFDSAAPSALKKAKQLINQVTSGEIGVNDAKLTSRILAEALSSPDGQEGVHAFLEKRKPNYSLIPNPSPKEKGAGASDSENLIT